MAFMQDGRCLLPPLLHVVAGILLIAAGSSPHAPLLALPGQHFCNECSLLWLCC